MKNTFFLAVAVLFISCSSQYDVDLILHNGKIYTVDEQFTIAEAMAVNGDSIVAVGAEHEILNKFHSKNQINLANKPVYPGLIDAHCHFVGYAKYSALLNLHGCRSIGELNSRLDSFIAQNDGDWIVGRGWDQNLWADKTFPTNTYLNEHYPNKYIVLKRVDGHAALVNQKVLDLAEFSVHTKISGGEIKVENGKCTGILVDNAIDVVEKLIPEPSDEEMKNLLLKAQEDCFSKGLTTLSDAGLDYENIELLRGMKREGSLKIGLYIMLNPTRKNFNSYLADGPIRENGITIRSFKFYADGALGSRGACLLKPYTDRNDHHGLILTSPDTLEIRAKRVHDAGFQVNTHAIGDSANRLILDIYSRILKGTNDKRWRIEHAQVVDPADLAKFREFNIIPSIQPTHAVSDMSWAKERLGEERIPNAYAYRSLLEQNGLVALGTDFPVESIDPLRTILAATNASDIGVSKDQTLTFEECIRGMTIWAAMANFEETEKGSIEPGKKADFIIFNRDLNLLNNNNLSDYSVISTYLSGQKVN